MQNGRLIAADSSPLLRIVLNGTLFNISWFVIVISHSTAVALAQVAAHLLFHFLLLGRGAAELRLVALVSLGGLLLDQLLFLCGVFNIDGRGGVAPLWLSCLWPVFATTLVHAFAGLRVRPYVAALVGGLGGAGSYVAGVRLSEVDFAMPLWSPLLIAALWALLFPLLLRMGARLVPEREHA